MLQIYNMIGTQEQNSMKVNVLLPSPLPRSPFLNNQNNDKLLDLHH